jgi:DNA repair protein RecO (recombination protein O)
MSRLSQRVQLTRAYVLHQLPFRDSSLIVEILAREYGRMSLFAHSARGPKARFAVLQPFRPLLLSWSGRGESPHLTAAELLDPSRPALPASGFMSGCYLNELLLTLTTRHDPHPELFDEYDATLGRLSSAARTAGVGVESCLRRFERRLLELIGYGLNLVTEADTGQPLQPDAYYRYRPGVHGLVRASPDIAGCVPGRVLTRIAEPDGLSSESDLRHARTLMRAAIDHCLDGRELRTRGVARSVASYPHKERNAG